MFDKADILNTRFCRCIRLSM